MSEDDTVASSVNPVGSSYTFTLSHFHFLASQPVLVDMMSVESIASFRELTRGSLASKTQHMAVPNQTRQPSGKHAGTVISSTLVVGMNPVNCLIEHMFTILLFMRAEREEDWYMPLCAVENLLLYFFAPCHFATVVRPTNHHSRVSATFQNSTLPNMENCWDAISNS